jgi:D-alanyl-D-alanine carboxypeptidase (penicillin-binding protein 5/6)
MKKRRLFSLFLSFALLLPLFSLTSADAYEDFDLDAKAGLLIEADTGEILYEKNAHQENFPASLTKVMVALLVFEAIDEGKIALTDSVTATESAFEGLSSDGSTANIVPGETMTVEQLLNCMLIVSANEACNILGETLYGSVDTFVARMNERATELGCEHTHFANATGLHNSQHYTTAWDLYLITREALKHDKFMEICNSKSYTVPATNMTDKPRELHSTNFLISNWRARGYVYRDAQGIKTGSTPEAGYCLISSALRGSSEALRRGDLRVLAAGNGRIAFSRAFGDESLIVCVNHSIGEWVLPAGRVRFAESAAPSPTGEVVLMRGGFCLLEPSDPEAHISIE